MYIGLFGVRGRTVFNTVPRNEYLYNVRKTWELSLEFFFLHKLLPFGQKMTARGDSFVVKPCRLVGWFENRERIYSVFLQGIPIMLTVMKYMY
jgi:hypothetical protein